MRADAIAYLHAIARATPVLPPRALPGESVALPSSLADLFEQAAAELARRYDLPDPDES